MKPSRMRVDVANLWLIGAADWATHRSIAAAIAARRPRDGDVVPQRKMIDAVADRLDDTATVIAEHDHTGMPS